MHTEVLPRVGQDPAPGVPPAAADADGTERTLALLSGGIGHRLNNALQAMIGHAELIASGVLTLSEVKRSARAIRRIGLRASKVLDKLTHYSRSLSEPALVDIVTELRELEPQLRGLLPATVRFDVSMCCDTCPVRIDTANLAFMLRNLVENAREAMPRGGLLTVELRVEGGPTGQAVLEVADTGSGLDPETRAHLFEPFFTTRPGGTGLGLATVYEVARERGGDIQVESAPGQGTRFVIRLPLAGAPAGVAAPAPSPTAAPAAPWQARSVVVVDDDVNISEIMKIQLGHEGYEVHAFTSGIAALEWFATPQARCDLLLTDLMMPGIDGVELSEKVRLSNPGVPVVFMTGYLTPAVEGRLAALPHAACLAKPFELVELTGKVQQMLKASGAP